MIRKKISQLREKIREKIWKKKISTRCLLWEHSILSYRVRKRKSSSTKIDKENLWVCQLKISKPVNMVILIWQTIGLPRTITLNILKVSYFEKLYVNFF